MTSQPHAGNPLNSISQILSDLHPQIQRTTSDPRPIVLMMCGMTGKPTHLEPLRLPHSPIHPPFSWFSLKPPTPYAPSSNPRSLQAPENPPSRNPSSKPSPHSHNDSPSTPTSTPATASTGSTTFLHVRRVPTRSRRKHCDLSL